MSTTHAIKSTTLAALAVFLGTASFAAAAAEKIYEVKTSSSTAVRGYFPRNAPPILTVPSGATVRIETISPSGLGNTTTDPITFLAGFGVQPHEIPPEAMDVWQNIPRLTGASAHYVTGPIYIEGAEPGDTLEVRIIDVEPRVTWGFNNQGTGGALPGFLTTSQSKLIRIKGHVALFSESIEIPLKPFQGVMAVAAADDFVSPLEAAAAAGLVSSRPPGPFGGNMDHNDLGQGTSLFLPVFQPGAQFFTGDPHAVQGNGEVSGTALELSNTLTAQFILHKNGGLAGPRAETATHYILMGIDVDHDEAMRKALRDALDFLQAEKGLTPAEAMSFASLAVDLNIAESVDFTQLVQARIPKRFFKNDYKARPRFWHHKVLHTENEAQRQGLDPVGKR